MGFDLTTTALHGHRFSSSFSIDMFCKWLLNNFSISEFICFQLDEANAQERLEKKIKNAPEGQGTVRMLTREEWEKMREVRPRTPFESTIARPNAKIRTGEPLRAVY